MDYIAKFDALPEADRALMIKIIKTWTAKGEDPTAIAGHVKRWLGDSVVAKNSDEGSKPPEDQHNPAQELEELVDADMDANKIKRSKAYERVLRARPNLNRALARQRDDTLRKAAALYA